MTTHPPQKTGSDSPDPLGPEEIEGLVSPYVHPSGENIFTVHSLEGMIGAAYARYSRARGGFKETFAREFLREGNLDPKKADALIERVLIAYGDDSVGELEGAHLSVELVSNLATKEIEDRRIGLSPIEQSTRYVFYDQKDSDGQWKYHVPEELTPPDAERYRCVLDRVFSTYLKALEKLIPLYENRKPLDQAAYDVLGKGHPQTLDELPDERARNAFRSTWRTDIRTRACDVARALLPAATLTHVGMFGNGRAYQNLITHLASHPLLEMHQIAGGIKEALSYKLARFVQRGGPQEYLIQQGQRAERLAGEFSQVQQERPIGKNGVVWIECSEINLLQRIAVLCLYPYSQHSFNQLVHIIPDPAALVRQVVGERPSRRDKLPRAFESGYPLMFELETDFGIYRDLERHRMLSQHRQPLGVGLGFEMPAELAEHCSAEVLPLLDEIASLQYHLKKQYGHWVAQYPVLLGYRLRYLMEMNLREACHLIELRSGVQGHPGYRQIAWQMHDLLTEHLPWPLSEMLQHVNHDTVEWARAESEARQRVKERNLEAQDI